MAKSVTKLSCSIKNLYIKPNYTLRACYSNNASKELHIPKINKADDAKELLHIIKNDNKPSSIIANLEENKNLIESNHVVAGLTAMQQFYIENKISPKEAQQSVDFINLVNMLNRHLIKLDLPEIIQSLKILNLLKISSSTMIVQSLLQLIRHSVNDLNLLQIYFLSFLFKKMEPTHLSRAIQKALPDVFISQLELKLDKEDLKELVQALKFASECVTDEPTIEYIIKAINNYTGELNVDSTVQILCSLCDIEVLPVNYKELLYRAYDSLLTYESLLEKEEVISTLMQILKKVASGSDDFYDPAIIDKLINKIVDNNYKYDKGLMILNKLNKISHVNIPLLKYLTSEIYNNPVMFIESYSMHTLPLVTGLANANYVPEFWNEFQKIIMKNSTKFMDDVMLTHFALHLASLNYFNSKLLSYIFEIEHNIKLITPAYYRTLQKLYQTVKTLNPSYSGPWPSTEIIEAFKTLPNLNKIEGYSLFPLLAKALGDPAFIKSDVKTSLGQDIDYLIVLQNESPIAIKSTSPIDTDSFTYEEDLIIPSDGKKIAVLLLPFEAYGRNIKILQPSALLNIKSLEAVSYTVVHISQELWKDMPEHERIPYLQREIGLKEKQVDQNLSRSS